MLRQRLGCFFIVISAAVILLYALPLGLAFFQNPQTVPMDWIAAGLAALLFLWFGWRLYSAGSTQAASQRPASLAGRLWQNYRDGRSHPDEDD